MTGVAEPADADTAFPLRARAGARQQAMRQRPRSLGLLTVALVVVLATTFQPRPGVRGTSLSVSLVLLAIVIGALGVLRRRQVGPAAQAPFFALLIAGSAGLGWLQPGGPGFLGDFVAAVNAATRLRDRAGRLAVAGVLASLAVASVRTDRPLIETVMTWLGAVALYRLGVFTNRLRAGQQQAEQLLAELERTRAAQARAAVLDERQRLAREMHDVLAHSLAGLALQLEAARLLSAREGIDPRLTQAVDRAHHLARSGLEDARRAIGLLREAELPGPDRLPELAGEFERDCAVPCTVELAGVEHDLGPQARLALYRVAQEALTNVRKHANPQRASLRLAYEPSGIRLVVQDHGRPPAGGERADAASGESGRFGLAGMRERVELLGGSLATAPTEDGFRVEVWIPV